MSVCSSCEIRDICVLKSANPKILRKIVKDGHYLHIERGQHLFHKGVYARGVCSIRSGKIKFSRNGLEGKEQILRFGKPGDLIAYQSVINNEPVTRNIIALTDVEACYIPKDIFLKHVKSDRSFALELLQSACIELSEANKMITNLAQKMARERLAEVLLVLHKTFNEDEIGCIDITLKREEIANTVGTATETVIRLLSEFKKSGYVELKGSRVKIINHSKLASIGNMFNYTK